MDANDFAPPQRKGPLTIVMVAAVGLAALVGLAFLISRLLAMSSSSLDLTYLPPDAEVIVRVRVADVWNAPLLEPVVNNPLLAMATGFASGQVGLKPDDVNSVTIGIAGISDAARGPAGALGAADVDSAHGIVVVRTTKDIDVDRVLAAAGDGARLEHARQSYHRFDAIPGQAVAAYFPNSRTAVIGPEVDVKASIDRGSSVTERPDLDFVDASHQILIVLAPRDPSTFGTAPERAGVELPPEVRRVQEELMDRIRGMSVGLTVSRGVDLSIRTSCADAEAAERVRSEFDRFLEQARGELAEATASTPPEYRELADLANRMVQEARATRSETIAEIAASMPPETKDVLARLMKQATFNPFALAGESAIDMGTGFGSDEPPQPPEALSLDEFNEAWRVTLRVEDEPARQVLEWLSDELGVELEVTEAARDAVEKAVTVNLDGVSRFEALEDVCRQIGTHARYSSETVVIEPGPRQSPIAFAGPFAVEVAEVEQFPAYATGVVRVNAWLGGLPAGLERRLRADSGQLLAIDRVTDADGADLADEVGSEAFIRLPSSDSGLVRQQQTIGLKSLLRDVERIGSISGQVQLAFPTRVEELRFETVEQGAQTQRGDIEATLKELDEGGDWTMTFDFRGAGYDDVVVVPRGGDDEPLAVGMSYGGGGDESGQSTISTSERPAAVSLFVITEREELRVSFELTDIPLVRSAEMPVRLEALAHAGHAAPVDVVFVRKEQGNSPKVTLRAVNHSNKDVRRLELRLDYLDGTGKKLDDWMAHHQGDRDSDKPGPAITVRAGQSAEFQVMAFFLPPEARSVRPRIERVVFADATLWEAPADDK